MRVIAGTAKGQRLQAPESAATRPLSDRAREGIFSAIGDWVEDAYVLDLYAGSGSIGIEALSRGAARVVFVEHSHKPLEALRKNLARTGFASRAKVIGQPVAAFLRQPPPERYHLFFLDPPWSLDTAVVAEEMLQTAQLAEPEAEMIVHRRHPDPLPVVPQSWTEAGIYRYGDTVIYRVAAA